MGGPVSRPDAAILIGACSLAAPVPSDRPLLACPAPACDLALGARAQEFCEGDVVGILIDMGAPGSNAPPQMHMTLNGSKAMNNRDPSNRAPSHAMPVRMAVGFSCRRFKIRIHSPHMYTDVPEARSADGTEAGCGGDAPSWLTVDMLLAKSAALMRLQVASVQSDGPQSSSPAASAPSPIPPSSEPAGAPGLLERGLSPTGLDAGAQPALPDAASEAGPSASREGARDTLVCALRVFPARVQAIVSAQPRARAPRGLVAAFVSATCDRRPPHRNSPPARGRRRVPHAAAGRRAARSRTRRALVRGAETRGRAGALQARRLPERVDGAHLGRVLRKLLPERGRGAERAGPPPRAFCAIFCPVRALQGPRTQWSRAAAARVFTITFPARLW